jgi:HSP20 family protein
MRYRRLSYGYGLVLHTATPPPQTAWRPAADIYETPRGISLTVELPGIDPDEVDVAFFENAVVVEGRRRMPSLDAAGIYHTAEIRRGPFRLEIALPARVDAEPVELHCELGLLSIRLAKASRAE